MALIHYIGKSMTKRPQVRRRIRKRGHIFVRYAEFSAAIGHILRFDLQRLPAAMLGGRLPEIA